MWDLSASENENVEVSSMSYEYHVIVPGSYGVDNVTYSFYYRDGASAKIPGDTHYNINAETENYCGSPYTLFTISLELWDDVDYTSYLKIGSVKHTVVVQYVESDNVEEGEVGSVFDGPFDLSTLKGISHFFIDIPDSVTFIGDYAFDGNDTSLKVVGIGQSSNLEHIGSYSFSKVDCDVFLPKSLSYIGQFAIGSSSSVTVDDDNPFFTNDESGNFMTKDGTSLIAYYGSEVDYSLPESVNSVRSYAFTGNDTINSISFKNGIEWGMFPFTGTSISDIQFDYGVSEIPDYLFAGTALVNLTIPNTISKIGTKAFYSISTLESVVFEDDARIADIGSYAFSSNPILKSVTFGSSASSVSCDIKEGAFYNCKVLTNVYVGDDFNLKTIGKGAFAKDAGFAKNDGYNETLKAVSFNSTAGIMIPSSVESIGVGAFANMDGTGHDSTTIEPGWRMMNDSASFAGNLKASNFTISFEENAKIGSIGDQAFAGLIGVTTIDLSNCSCLESIGYQSFRNTYNATIKLSSVQSVGITNISLSKSLTSIGNQAFQISYAVPVDYLLDSLEIPS